jgi:phosphohistidine phosphatase
MQLYLVRHAIAAAHDPVAWPDDRDRPLTPQGMKKFRRAARGLAELVPTVDALLSSPLVRAWQTAVILQEQAGWPEPTRFEQLEPGRPPAEVLEALQPHANLASVALVGHEPSLHELASFLLGDDPNTLRLTLKKGGTACLVFAETPRPGGADLLWLLQPRVLRTLD